ncbi:hypothetical protein RR11_3089 [Ruegeria sp. R11]|nr:hypothetical protein RR11_3089 [Ruegeria sp. R11]
MTPSYHVDRDLPPVIGRLFHNTGITKQAKRNSRAVGGPAVFGM